MINNHTIIVSTVSKIPRSSGDIFDSGIIGNVAYSLSTSLFDEEQYNQYTNILLENSGLDYVGAISMDGMYVPYTTYYEYSGLLPKMERPTSTEIGVYELHPFNPNNMFGTGIIVETVDTGTFNSSVWESGGHNISIAMTASNYSTIESLDSGLHPTSNHFDSDYYARKKVEIQNVRSIAHRTPSVWSGWGYNIDGNPVPANTGDPSLLHPEALWNTALWKTGPLDIRWDQSRGVWSAGSTTKIYLSKVTNTYNPINFSYEVDRSYNRAQYARIAPQNQMDFSSSGTIHDPEYLAYSGNPSNTGTYESLNYTDIDFPHYEAFIIRATTDAAGPSYYNIWTEDCSDCGHLSNPCPSGTGTAHGDSSVDKKILIENPLKQNLDTGDLCFTVKTGRSKNINTGSFIGGSGTGAAAHITTNTSGVPSLVIDSSGSGYLYGGFGLMSAGVCIGVDLTFSGGQLSGGTITPNTGLPRSASYEVSVYPTNATAQTESLDVHWIMQAEFKSQQVITHVECDGGLMQTCSVKIQTQGFKTCEWCGEDTTLINSF